MTTSRPAHFTEPADGQIVGVAELAWWIDVPDRTYVSRWAAAGRIPPPTARIAAGPVWVVDTALRQAVSQIASEYTRR